MAISGPLFVGQRDGVDVPAVVGLGAVGGAAIAEKPGRIGIGAQAQILDSADAGPRQPRRDIAAKIEQGMAVARRRRRRTGCWRGPRRQNARSDRGRPRNWPAGSSDRSRRGFGRARRRAAPSPSTVASMTPVSAPRQPACAAPITPRLRIGEQNRAAIGRGHADGERAHAGDDGVGARPRVGRPRRFGDDDVRRVDLIGGEEAVRLDAERRRHARAIFRDVFGACRASRCRR